ncbi:MAG: potassium transporter Kup [Planctomycetota bacterium]|nr:potassium transporter Kup [Planctomycetota bacterium]
MKTPPSRKHLQALTIGALGVVYGDIGTSPLYAFRECFNGPHGMQPNAQNVYGVLSMMVWSIVLIVCIKYVSIVLRADNRGEGGILALLALATSDTGGRKLERKWLITLGMIGAALLYGDGMITPCVTVFGALEGLHIATDVFDPWVLPLSIVVLIALFTMQSRGTKSISRVFGPVMLLWFTILAALGANEILAQPYVLQAFSPTYAVSFLRDHGYGGFLIFGTVFLCVTGAETLYADLGHFGRTPITRAWFAIVFPALLLNYFGQGALLLGNPKFQENPFFYLAPEWALYPMVALSTVASVIASQAVISGAFSLTTQAIQLGFLPRLEILHTSSEERGQVYMPWINRLLLLSCIGLALGFQSSSRLAGAYGIALTMTMLLDSLLFFIAARTMWQWPIWKAGALCSVFIGLELVFFSANATKLLQGGWFPLLVALVLFTVMSTWRTGRKRLGERLAASSHPLASLMTSLERGGVLRVPGTAFYMSGNPSGTPIALLHNLKHNKVLHQHVVLLTFTAQDIPHVDEFARVQIEPLPLGFQRVTANFGFMERPRLDIVIKACERIGSPLPMHDATFFLSRETILSTGKSRLHHWRASLFALMARNGQSATAFFGLPVDRVVELGLQVEI